MKIQKTRVIRARLSKHPGDPDRAAPRTGTFVSLPLRHTGRAEHVCADRCVLGKASGQQRLLMSMCRGSHESQEGFQLYGAGSWPPGPHLPPTVFQGQVYSQ